MPKLPVIRPKEALRVLAKLGFVVVRQKGSHVQLKKANLLVTVPVHSRDLNPETLKSILRQAKLSIEEFAELL